MMRKLAVAFFPLAGLLVFNGCGGGGSGGGGGNPFTVSPSNVTLALNATQQFNAGAAAGVSWSVNGAAGGNATVGTIDSNGLYHAPANEPNPKTVTVTGSTGGQSSSANVTIVYPNNNAQSQGLPVKMGTTGGNANDTSGNRCCSGTLGAVVQKGGIFYVLSVNHVLAKSDAGSIGDPITQPGLIDNNCAAGTLVANLSQIAKLKPASSPGPAPSNVDAAIAQIVPGAVDTSGSILDLGAASSSSIAAAPPSSTVAIPVNVISTNEGVAKVGRSTGLTCSTLQSITTTVSVDYSQTCGGATSFTATFSNQLIINGGTFTQNGDSGALLVTSDTARPLGLIYGGNSNTSSANPIQDVNTALGPFTFPGGADHGVSCQTEVTVQSASSGGGSQSAMLSAGQQQRALDVRNRYAASLLRQDPTIQEVEVGASADDPRQAALVLKVSGTPAASLPHQIEGVRTRVVNSDGTQSIPAMPVSALQNTITIKEANVNAWMSQPGVIGFGVGRSRDNPAETAIAIYVEAGRFQGSIPAEIGGVRTQVFEGDRFRAGGSGAAPQSSCSKPAPKLKVVSCAKPVATHRDGASPVSTAK